MKKILQVFAEPLLKGGQESFVMNIYRNIDKNKFQFDFFTPYCCDNSKMKEEIEKFGGKVFAQGKKFETIKRKIYFIQELKKFLKTNKYEIIHIHSGSIFALAYGSKIAKKYGARKIIVHSHSTGIDNLKHKVIKILSKRVFINNATDYLACSNEAAEWKFPKNTQYTVIKNGIELEKFIYNEEIRKEYRKKLKIQENDFVIGHVGRFESEKNHDFLVDIFEDLQRKEKNAKLLLVGAGSLRNNIINKIKEKKLEDKVIMLENREDINKILQAIDIFLLPSFYEGLPVVAIEAQAAGLQTLCSEKITEETMVTDLFHKFELKEGKEKWVNKILEYRKYQRKNTIEEIRNEGYDAKMCAKALEEVYQK